MLEEEMKEHLGLENMKDLRIGPGTITGINQGL